MNLLSFLSVKTREVNLKFWGYFLISRVHHLFFKSEIVSSADYINLFLTLKVASLDIRWKLLRFLAS